MSLLVCTCGHLLSNHDFDQVAQKHTACLVRGDVVQYWEDGAKYADFCGEFTPDNLRSLEYLEKKNASIIS